MKNDTKRDFRNLKIALDRHGLRQLQLASLAHADANTVNNWVKGHARVPGLVWLFFDLLDARPELKDLILGLKN